MSGKFKYTTYLACAIESSPPDGEVEWKTQVKSAFNRHILGIYDPVEQEESKTGKPAGAMCHYITGCKRGGRWGEFLEGMGKIWWGDIKSTGNKISILQALRNKAVIDGNHSQEFQHWGDYEAVVRSDFIIAYLEKNVPTVGTLDEIHLAYLFDIPIFQP